MQQLKRELGLGGAIMMGLGSMIGIGVFVSIGIASGVAGPGSRARRRVSRFAAMVRDNRTSMAVRSVAISCSTG